MICSTTLYLQRLMSDKMKLSKGQIIHIGGLPFELEADTLVLGCKNNLKLINEAGQEDYKSLSVADTLTEAHLVTSETIKPSSESIKGLW